MDLSALASQVGQLRSQVTAPLGLGPAELYRVTFDPQHPPLQAGSALPPGWHGLYFHTPLPRAGLRPDGSAATTGVVPDVPLPLRVFASERTRFHDTLRLGDTCVQRAELVGLHEASARRGPLVLVTVRESIFGSRGLAVETERVTAFVAKGRTPAAPPAAPTGCAWSESRSLDAIDLFRFSAMTLNDHRAHYDHAWATQVEGHQALLVHGPLSALLLLDFARRRTGASRLDEYEVRAVSALHVDEPFRLLGAPAPRGIDLWLAGPRGVAVTARLRTSEHPPG